MAFGSLGSNHSRPNAEINTTPLVDVMLVLLVIFILTAPLFTHTVKLDLPRASHQADPKPPPAVTLALDAAGAMYWDNVPIDELIPHPNDVVAAVEPKAHPRIPLPVDLYRSQHQHRDNSMGLNLANDDQLRELAAAVKTRRAKVRGSVA